MSDASVSSSYAEMGWSIPVWAQLCDYSARSAKVKGEQHDLARRSSSCGLTVDSNISKGRFLLWFMHFDYEPRLTPSGPNKSSQGWWVQSEHRRTNNAVLNCVMWLEGCLFLMTDLHSHLNEPLCTDASTLPCRTRNNRGPTGWLDVAFAMQSLAC